MEDSILDIGRCVDGRSFHHRAALCRSPSYIFPAPCRLWRHAGFGRGTQFRTRSVAFGQGGQFWHWRFCRHFISSPSNCCPFIWSSTNSSWPLRRPCWYCRVRSGRALGISHRLAPTVGLQHGAVAEPTLDHSHGAGHCHRAAQSHHLELARPGNVQRGIS